MQDNAIDIDAVNNRMERLKITDPYALKQTQINFPKTEKPVNPPKIEKPPVTLKRKTKKTTHFRNKYPIDPPKTEKQLEKQMFRKLMKVNVRKLTGEIGDARQLKQECTESNMLNLVYRHKHLWTAKAMEFWKKDPEFSKLCASIIAIEIYDWENKCNSMMELLLKAFKHRDIPEMLIVKKRRRNQYQNFIRYISDYKVFLAENHFELDKNKLKEEVQRFCDKSCQPSYVLQYLYDIIDKPDSKDVFTNLMNQTII